MAIDLSESAEIREAREEEQRTLEAVRAALARYKRLKEAGSPDLPAAKAELKEARQLRREAKQVLELIVGTYPEAFLRAREAYRRAKVERVIQADPKIAKDDRKHVGQPQGERKASLRRVQIETVHQIEITDPEHYDVVCDDVDGKLTARIERAALARLYQAGTPDLDLYDTRVDSRWKRQISRRGAKLSKKIEEAQVSFKVLEAEFFCRLHDAVLGLPVGHGRTDEGFFPQLGYLEDYVERSREVYGHYVYTYAYPLERPPATDRALAKSIGSMMRLHGHVESVRMGDRRHYLFQLEMGAPGLNEQTILAAIQRKRDERSRPVFSIRTFRT